VSNGVGLNVDRIAAHTATVVGGQKRKAAEKKNKTDAKQKKTAAQEKKTAVKWLPRWFTEFSWLLKSACGGKAKCSICERFSPYPNGRKGLMGTTGTTSIDNSAFSRHQRSSKEHAASLLAQGNAATLRNQLVVGDDGIRAVTQCFQSLYWLAKEHIAHEKYASLRQLLIACGCTLIDQLDASGNASYTSARFIAEVYQTFSDVIEMDIMEVVHESPVVGMTTDEATDSSVSNQMSLFWRTVDMSTGQARSFFAGLERVKDHNADGLTQVIVDFIGTKQVPIEKVMAFGGDGASVIMGKNNGVSTQLQRMNPRIVVAHGAAHNLALAAAHAGEEVDFENPRVRTGQNFIVSEFHRSRTLPRSTIPSSVRFSTSITILPERPTV
jgi:hypothetical protein